MPVWKGKKRVSGKGLKIRKRTRPPVLRHGMPLDLDKVTARPTAGIRAQHVFSSPIGKPAPVARQPGAFPRVVGPRETARLRVLQGGASRQAASHTAVKQGVAYGPASYRQVAQPLGKVAQRHTVSALPGMSAQEAAIAGATGTAYDTPNLLPADGLVSPADIAAAPKEAAGFIGNAINRFKNLSTPSKLGLAALGILLLK